MGYRGAEHFLVVMTNDNTYSIGRTEFQLLEQALQGNKGALTVTDTKTKARVTVSIPNISTLVHGGKNV